MASEFASLPVGMLMIVMAVKAYYLLFAVLTIVGGIMGYVKAKSMVSLAAGTISGALLIVASLMLPTRPIRAYVIALLVSVLLAGKFLPAFVHKRAVFPGGLMSVLSLAGIVLTLLAWYGK